MKWFYMAGGGILGVVSRYLVGAGVHRFTGLGFPYGTLVVNVSGCFIIGLASALGKGSWEITPNQRAFLFVGYLGAYTTFSSYMLESYELINRQQWLAGSLYLVGSVLAGAIGFLLGVFAARWIAE